MPGFDRSNLKGTSLKTLKTKDEDYAQKRPAVSGNVDRNFLTIDSGNNKFRFFPFHPDDGGESYSEAKCVSFLEVTTQDRDDDGKPIDGRFVVKRKPVFNSKVHGSLEIDLVEEYMKLAKDVAIPNLVGDNSDRGGEIWKKVTGMQGVKPSDSWVVYACKWDKKKEDWGPVGLLEFKKSVKDQLLEKAIELTAGDTASPDPYSDPDLGFAVTIEKTGEKLDTRYKVSVESTPVRNGTKLSQEYVPVPLTDEQLEQWSKLPSLHKLFVGAYKRSDFVLQVEGLQNFDTFLQKAGMPIGVFELEQFQDTVNAIDTALPEEDEKKQEARQSEPPKSTEKPKTTVIQKPNATSAPVTRELTAMERIKLKHKGK